MGIWIAGTWMHGLQYSTVHGHRLATHQMMLSASKCIRRKNGVSSSSRSLLFVRSCRPTMASAATRSCAKLVQTLGSSSASSEQKRTAAAELLALPMTPQTWVLAIGAIPALVQMLTQQPAEAAAGRELTMRVLHHISSHVHVDKGAVRTASGDDIAALVPLLLRLSSREDVCGMVALTLASLALNPDNQRQIMEAGAIAPLVQLLKSSTLTVHVPAAMTLAQLSADSTPSSSRAEIVAAGAVAPLVHLLKSSSEIVQYHALMALRPLCDVEHAAVVARAGAIPSLIGLLASPSTEIQADALRALGILARNSDLIGPISAAGAIPLMTQLLSSTAVLVQQQAAVALANIVAGRDTHSAALAAGAIAPLVRMLKPDSSRAASAAALALANLAMDDAEGQAAIIAAGALGPLARMLKAAGTAPLFAAMAMRHLAGSADNVALIISVGAVPLLVKLLPSAASALAQEQASMALSALAAHDSAHSALIEADCILPLLRLPMGSCSGASGKAIACALEVFMHLTAAPSSLSPPAPSPPWCRCSAPNLLWCKGRL